jgi:ethanolamine utilization protein EutQ (cupin superfamily)
MKKAELQPEATEVEVIEKPKAIEVVELPAVPKTQEVKPKVDARPLDEKIMEFALPRNTGKPIMVNDFLKSTVPLQVGIGQPEWAKQGFSKTVRYALEKLIAEKKISVQADAHSRLGKAFYIGDAPETQYYSIANVLLYIEIL